MSADPPKRHARFREALGLHFDLLSDPELTVAKRYGVFVPTPDGEVAGRSVFLIDRDGKLRFVDRDFRVPRELAGTPLQDAIDELAPGASDPLAALESLPEPERSAKTVLCRLVIAALAEDLKTIESLLHGEFSAAAGSPAAPAGARRRFLEQWVRTFEAEDFTRTEFAEVLDIADALVLDRDAATPTALRTFGSEVRTLAGGMREGDVLIAVRCHGLRSDDGSTVLSRDVALILRKEGDEWRIAALCGR